MTMLVDIENLSAEALKNIIASRGALDAAFRRRASAQEEIDRCKANLRGLGVGLDGEMPADPEPRGVVANGGAILPPRNPVTGRTRKPRDTKPRGGIRLEPAVVASVRQALEAAAGPLPTADIVEATSLRAPVVIAACRYLGAKQLGKNRGTRWAIAVPAFPLAKNATEVEDEDPTDEGDEP